MAKTILIIEDEAPIRDMLRFILSNAEFNVLEAEGAQQAMAILATELPDIFLIDWMLPDKSGVDIVRTLKSNEQTTDIPVIMLTARAAEENKIKGFEAGADDYVVKPFSPRELIARINAVMRRAFPSSDCLEVGELRLELATQRVTLSKKEIKFGPKEYQLLRFLMGHPDRVYSRSQLLDRVWGMQTDVDDRTVDVCIRRIRKSLGERYQQLIETVHGTGYRFSSVKIS